MTVINHKDLDILDSNKGKRCKIIDKHNSKIEGIFVKTQCQMDNRQKCGEIVKDGVLFHEN